MLASLIPKCYELPFHWEKFSTRKGTISDSVQVVFMAFRSKYCLKPSGEPISVILNMAIPLSLLLVLPKSARATPLLWNSIRPSWDSLPCGKFWPTVAPPVPFHLKPVDPDLNDGEYPAFPCLVLHLFASVSHRWESRSRLRSITDLPKNSCRSSNVLRKRLYLLKNSFLICSVKKT